MNQALFSTGIKNDWETPLTLFADLDREFHFTLDPCAVPETAKCEKFFTPAENGLLQDWGGEVVFCNPPYGNKKSDPNRQDEWVRKCYEESKKPETTVVALIPSRTDTERFHRYILGKAEIRFLQGRVQFVGAKDPAPFPSMIVVWRSTTLNIKENKIMATKKTETPIDSSTMNVWQKLLMVRMAFLANGTKKSGKNLHAEFTYFELVDIVPMAEALFAQNGLLMLTSFLGSEAAVATMVNIDNPEETITFSIPLQLIAEPAKFRMNEVQGMGAAVTYYRRYLYMLVLDLVEADAIDGLAPKSEDDDAPAPVALKKSSKPVTPAERKDIKEELTSNEGQASEDQVETLKALLKKLMEMDPEQEEFVQEVAMKTNSFTEIKATACDALIENLADMISAYTQPTEE